VKSNERSDCGFPGIDESYCVSRLGCCWDSEFTTDGNSGCFYPQGNA